MATLPIAPTLTGPIDDDALHDVLQQTLAGVAGIAASLVRPSSQVEPANTPDFAVNWMSFRISVSRPESTDHYQGFNGDLVSLESTQVLEVLLSSFGPLANTTMNRVRAGLSLDINRSAWRQQGLSLLELTEQRHIPALVKESYRSRVDCTMFLHRALAHTFRVAAVETAQVGIHNELYLTPITIQQEP